MIDAFVLAYEVAGRLWRATQARLAVHPHGTYGPLAAALALARLRGDSPDQVRAAMNIAMTLGTAASRQTLGDGATIRNIYTGHSGRAGFEALTLRDLGFTGEHDAPSSILGNLFGEAFDPAVAIDGLGSVWWMRKSYFKRFASGRYIHAALDAVELMLTRLGGPLDPDTIARVDISTFFMAATMGQQHVDTPFGMRFSIPALVASRFVRGPEALTDDASAAFADVRVHALAQRVFVTEDKTATAVYPDRQPTTVTLTFQDQRQEQLGVERMFGESDHPLPPQGLCDKFLELTIPSLGRKAAGAAFSAFLSIDGCEDVGTPLRAVSEAVASHAKVSK